MNDAKASESHNDVTEYIADRFQNEKRDPSPSPEQRRAIDMCCDMGTAIAGVTGGAGTGKTFVLGKVFAALQKEKISAVLCAPTGRAAKRIYELTGVPAKTVHKLLEYPLPHELMTEPNKPKRNKLNPLTEQVIVVDESSMISSELYRNLIDALGKKAVIRFFGDDNQLPPVEDYEELKPTSPFAKILDKFPKVVLNYNFRNEDLILDNAQRILRGSVPRINARFVVLYTPDPLRQLLSFVKGHEEFTTESHQIIIPTRKGRYGTGRVNPSLQLIYNSTGPMLRLQRYDRRDAPLTVRAGDKFLWIKNDYQLDLFNGEIGSIEWIGEEDGEVGLRTPERTIHVPARLRTFSPAAGTMIYYDPRKQIELGYAVTTHKSQGSEFDSVVYCMSSSAPFLLNRRNFYTAVTRARKLVVVIADRRAMGYSMRRYM